jgi:hypothetical protein
MRPCQNEDDYFRVRSFLREVFLLNNRLEHSWNVARLDYWRWHLIATCQLTPPFEQVTVAWETENSELVGWQFASQIIQTDDGGVLLAGFSMSPNQQVDT